MSVYHKIKSKRFADSRNGAFYESKRAICIAQFINYLRISNWKLAKRSCILD